MSMHLHSHWRVSVLFRGFDGGSGSHGFKQLPKDMRLSPHVLARSLQLTALIATGPNAMIHRIATAGKGMLGRNVVGLSQIRHVGNLYYVHGGHH
jgi:hypothetical protein